MTSTTVDELVWTGVGGVGLKGQRHLPAARPRAVIVLAHGINEHSGRYDHVVAALVDKDIAVFTIDHRGHGRSEGQRSQVRRFDDLVDDFELVTSQASKEQSSIPLYILGHSMGGLIATRYALRHQASLAGLILSAPAIVIDENTSPILRQVLLAIARVAPNLALIPERHGLLSRDPEVERLKKLDPLNRDRRTTIGSARALLTAGEQTQKNLGQLSLPLLVMHGGDDTLTYPSGSRMVVDRAASTDKTLKIWPGLRHEIFNEPEGPEVIAYLVDWLGKRMEV